MASKRIYFMRDWADYNTGELTPPYVWIDRFTPEDPETYPEDEYALVREDIAVLRAHLADVPRPYFAGIQNAFATIQSGEIYLTAKLVLLLTMLTGLSISQVIGARLYDIDADARIWTIPAEHNQKKSRETFHAPLSDAAAMVYTQAVEMVQRGESALLLPNRNGRPLNTFDLNKYTRKLGLPLTPSALVRAFQNWALFTGFRKEMVCAIIGRVVSKPLTDLQDTADAFAAWITNPGKAAGLRQRGGEEDQYREAAGKDRQVKSFEHLKPMTEDDLALRWEAQVQMMQDWAAFLNSGSPEIDPSLAIQGSKVFSR